MVAAVAGLLAARCWLPAIRYPLSAIALLIVVALSGGCYRVSRPPQIDEPVRVEVVSDDARLVHAQAYLQKAIADSLVGRLGWRVSPSGSARVEIHIAEERIDPITRDARGVTVRWSIRLGGKALLVCQKGNLLENYTGVGYAYGFLDENEALQKAADNAAFNLTNWLENEARKFK